MMKVYNTEPNSENLPGGDDKRSEMLFELFDHAIDEHLADCAENAHDQHMQHEDLMSEEESEDINNFEEDA